METIAEKTKRIIADTLGVDETRVIPGADLRKDLGADSLEVVEVVLNLEKEFNVSIPDAQIERMKNVEQFTAYLEKVRPVPLEVFYQLRAA